MERGILSSCSLLERQNPVAHFCWEFSKQHLCELTGFDTPGSQRFLVYIHLYGERSWAFRRRKIDFHDCSMLYRKEDKTRCGERMRGTTAHVHILLMFKSLSMLHFYLPCLKDKLCEFKVKKTLGSCKYLLNVLNIIL